MLIFTCSIQNYIKELTKTDAMQGGFVSSLGVMNYGRV